MKISYLLLIISGLILAIPGTVFLLIGAGILISGSNPSAGAGFMAMSAATAVPGGVLLLIGMRKRSTYKNMEMITGIVKSYRRITTQSIAEKIGIPVTDVDKILADIVVKKKANGYVDRETGEFVIHSAESDPVETKNCRACGAPITGKYMKGETITCKACGTVQ